MSPGQLEALAAFLTEVEVAGASQGVRIDSHFTVDVEGDEDDGRPSQTASVYASNGRYWVGELY